MSLLLCLLAAAPLGPAPDLPHAALDAGRPPLVVPTRIEDVHAGHERGHPWLRGPAYKAHADEAGLHFVPFLGSAAARNWTVTFAVEQLAVGGAPLALASPQARLEGDTIVVDRGSIVERYEGQLEGVAQSFVFDGLTGRTGDLVVEVSVKTDLELVRDGAGYVLQGPDGVAHIGGATALDGRGAALALESERTAAGIAYRVPGWFVELAGDGLVIDPLVSSGIAANLSSPVQNPDVAYDSANDTICLVYEGVFSGADTDLHYVTLSATTLAIVDSGLVELIAGNAFEPRVASLPGPGRFIVCYEQTDAFDRAEIFARSRSAAAGSNWEITETVATFDEFFEPRNPDLGGETFAGAEAFALVAYEWSPRGVVATSRGIRARRLDPAAAPVAPPFVLAADTGPTDHAAPAVSKFAGFGGVHDGWWVAYAAGPLGTEMDEVRASRVSFSQTVTPSNVRVFAVPPGAGVERVDVSAPYTTPDVQEAVHFVAQTASPSGSRALWCVTRERFEVGTLVSPRALGDVDVNDATENAFPSLATSFRKAAIVYGDFEASSAQIRLVASSLERELDGGAAVGERRVALDDIDGLFYRAPNTTSVAAGGVPSSSDVVLATWANPTPGGNLDIHLAIVDFPEPRAVGRSFCTGNRNSTGELAFLAAYGDNLTTTPKTLRATSVPPNQFGLFVVSQSFGAATPPTSQGLLCLVGSIGRYNGSIASSGPLGVLEFSMDPTAIPQGIGTVAAIAGQTWGFQAWHRDVNPVQTSNFTSGVQIRF
ncbi:MAG: hypothetical protein AAFU73_05745 [Planctomycetota bacterium]